jgi:predicted O-linked N-acetylglucosamine transferase (SPINDLY family)
MPRFEVYVYSDASRPDATSERLKTLVQHWKDVRHLSDQKLAELILADGIDILVDLAGHTAQNRLMVFAQKPGAVQMTYLGYPNTTGLPASVMNYRITDSVCDPPGQADELHTEKLLRIDCGIDVEGSACAEAHPTKDRVSVGSAPRTAPCAGMDGTESDRGKGPQADPT